MKKVSPPDGCVPPRGGRRLGGRKIRVAVLFGGQSAEHEVSLASAKTIMSALDPARYEVRPVRIDRKGRWLLEGGSPAAGLLDFAGMASRGRAGQGQGVDVVFPVLHGPMGEDGTVQGFLELSRVPYVGCGVLASAVGMDKDVAKRLALQACVPVLPHVLLRSQAEFRAKEKLLRALRLPVFVKPVCLGSSVGVRKVGRWGGLASAVRHAFRFDTKVMVEQGVDGQEICCAVLGKPGDLETSVCGEVVVTGNHDFFDYASKYTDAAGHDLLIPARLSGPESAVIRDLAARVFEAFDASGMARVDFFMDRRSRRAYFGEINTIPGFTEQSLYPALFQASGWSMGRILDRLIALALERSSRRQGLKLSP
ncbi:MAG: D-alanine--D-alanine ligase [Elusimicrobia bacterium]|nr:D-alanine--D-alanine ligase [Elusimicrobiota bacterium]